MSRWLALVEKDDKESYSSTRHLTKPDKTTAQQPEVGFCQVLSNCQVGFESKSLPNRGGDFEHGFSIGGRPLTWTGKVVSLEAWRNLTEWEKHGPNGRVWSGKTQNWEDRR